MKILLLKDPKDDDSGQDPYIQVSDPENYTMTSWHPGLPSLFFPVGIRLGWVRQH